jgi:hypothetical protein
MATEATKKAHGQMSVAKGWMLENVPAQAVAEAARLEAELEQHRGADSTVRLPD